MGAFGCPSSKEEVFHVQMKVLSGVAARKIPAFQMRRASIGCSIARF
jgi:hypothetical protein